MIIDKFGDVSALKTYKIKGEDLIDLSAKLSELQCDAKPELSDTEQLPKLRAEVNLNNLRESLCASRSAIASISKDIHLLQSLINTIQDEEQRDPMLECIKSIEASIESVLKHSDEDPNQEARVSKRKKTVETEVLNLHIPLRVTSIKNLKSRPVSHRVFSDVDKNSHSLSKASLMKKQTGVSPTV
jgi:hypothetical protein